MTKEAIRAEMAGRVKNLSPVYCREADAAICRWVEQSEFYREARTVFCYVGAKWEIDTTALLRSALRDGKRLVLPLCTQPGVMEARQIGSLGDLVSGKFGILAPKLQCPLVPPEEIDLALVPCCTGNAGGQRLGYGGAAADPDSSARLVFQLLRQPANRAACENDAFRRDMGSAGQHIGRHPLIGPVSRRKLLRNLAVGIAAHHHGIHVPDEFLIKTLSPLFALSGEPANSALPIGDIPIQAHGDE